MNHHKAIIRDFRRRFFISLALTIPILILSPSVQALLGYEIRFPGDWLALLAFSTAVYLYGGSPFLKGLVKELKGRTSGMMVLIGVAITVAYAYSSAVAIGLSGKPFFWELATLIDIMLLGHWMEMRSILGGVASTRGDR